MNYRGLIQNGRPVKSWRDRFIDMGGWAQIPNRGFTCAKKDDKAEILIYEQIGYSWWDDSGIGAKEFAEKLKALGDVSTINLRINSPGGDVTEADAIYTQLVQHKAKVNVSIDGLAASAASYIAMAGDSIAIAEHAKFMIHNAWGIAIGNAADMRKTAEILETVDTTIRVIYHKRTGQTDAKLRDWMAAETWFTGQQALDEKFADTLIPAKGKPEDSAANEVAAHLDLMRMRLDLARTA